MWRRPLLNGSSAFGDIPCRVQLDGTTSFGLASIASALLSSTHYGLGYRIRYRFFVRVTCMGLSLTQQVVQRATPTFERRTRASSSAYVRFSSPLHETLVVTQHALAGVFHHSKNSQGADPRNEHRTCLQRGWVMLFACQSWWSCFRSQDVFDFSPDVLSTSQGSVSKGKPTENSPEHASCGSPLPSYAVEVRSWIRRSRMFGPCRVRHRRVVSNVFLCPCRPAVFAQSHTTHQSRCWPLDKLVVDDGVVNGPYPCCSPMLFSQKKNRSPWLGSASCRVHVTV